jgi:class 3 adenylate cyclase/Tfp pilus assembly protein PilF
MVSSVADPVETARAALDRHAWQEAYDALAEADASGPLSGEGLQLLSQAAWWAAHPDVSIEAAERAFAAFLEEENLRAAGMAAFELARQHGMRMSMPLASGWMARAERLAQDDPDAPVHGWLAWMRGVIAWVMGNHDQAVGHYDRAMEIADRIGDRGLHGMSLHDKGHSLCLQGKVTEGLTLMDEAMASAVAGEMDPASAGYVYCGMIAACSRMGDYGRAGEWTDATTRWCERQSITAFPGVCRVHRAELMRLRGSYPRAEEEARLACEELPRFNLLGGVGHAFYEIAEVRRRRGDLRGAEEAYAQAHEHGGNPQPGLSLLRLAQGKTEAAMAGIRQAVAEATTDRVARAKGLAAQAEIAAAAGDLEIASGATEELELILRDYGSTALHATLARVRGAVRMARGDPNGALPELRRAREGWHQVGAPYEVAEVRLLLGKACRAIGDEEAALMELRAARSTFERLGARTAAASVNEVLGELAASAEKPERLRRAFMFTDIVKSTDLVSAIGDEAWEDLLAWHDQALRSLFASHGGDVAHHTGDGFFVAFEDVEASLRCGVAIQRALAEHRRTHGFAVQVRIGVHAAEATRRGQDWGGMEVHKAARIAALAEGGEILVSEEIMQETDGRFPLSEPREVTLKGVSAPVRVATVEWRSSG